MGADNLPERIEQKISIHPIRMIFVWWLEAAMFVAENFRLEKCTPGRSIYKKLYWFGHEGLEMKNRQAD